MLKKGKIKEKSLKPNVCKHRVRFISLKFRPLKLRYPSQNQHPETRLPGLRMRLSKDGKKNLQWRCLSPLFDGEQLRTDPFRRLSRGKQTASTKAAPTASELQI